MKRLKKWCRHIRAFAFYQLHEYRYIYVNKVNGECFTVGWKQCPHCGARRPQG